MKKICPHCNNAFESNHARRIYCSDSHRISAYNKRKGFRVAIVPPNEDKGLKIPNSNLKADVNLKKSDFNAGNIGAATTGSLIANSITELFKNPNNKPLTKKEFDDNIIVVNQNIVELAHRINMLITALSR